VRASEVFTLAQSSAISLKRAGAKRLSGVLGADLSTAADGACDGPADAVDKSCAAPQAVAVLGGLLLLLLLVFGKRSANHILAPSMTAC
jgi:hypothetical protein